MKPWMIAPIIAGGILFSIVLLLIFGKARLRITVCGDVKAVLKLFGIPLWFYPERGFDLPPGIARRRLSRIRKRKRRKKRRKQRRISAGKPTLNILDDLQVIFTILKLAYEKGKGKLSIRIRRFHVRVATDDPAKTAILWGSVVGAASVLLQWIHTNFNTVERREGAINVYPDYLSKTTDADIRIVVEMPTIPFFLYIGELFSEYEIKRMEMRRRAKRRLEKKKAKEASRAANLTHSENN